MTTISTLCARLCVGFSYSKRRKDRDMFCLPHAEYVCVYNLISYKWDIYIYIYIYIWKLFFLILTPLGQSLATIWTKKINIGTNYENLDVKYLNYIFFMFLTYVSNFVRIRYYWLFDP